MTPPPRLAPLTEQESGELDALLARVCLPTFSERERDIARLAARGAQRLARARERRAVLEEAINAVQWVNTTPLDDDVQPWACGWCSAGSAKDADSIQHHATCAIARLEALRDQEEA